MSARWRWSGPSTSCFAPNTWWRCARASSLRRTGGASRSTSAPTVTAAAKALASSSSSRSRGRYADRDRIYALVRATGCNQDGRTSGITVPNPEAQKSLILSVLEHSEIPASKIQYVEAHGTGTPVGDPIEARAIGETLGRNREHRRAADDRLGQSEPGPSRSGVGRGWLDQAVHVLQVRRHSSRRQPG